MGRQAGGELAAALAHVDEAHDGVHQVGVGGELQRVHAALHQRLAQFGLALGRDACEALAEARVVRVHHHLLAGLGVAQGQQAEVGELQLQRIQHPHRHHFVALRQPRQRALPARAR